MAACGQDRRAGRLGAAGRTALLVALAVALGLFMTSCRDSDALTEKFVGDVDEYEVDETVDPVALENPESESNMSQEEDESDRESDEDQDDPDYDEDDADTDEETAQNVESEYSESDGDATSGDSVSDGTSSSSVTDGSGDDTTSSPRITFDFTGNSSIVSIGDASTSDADETDDTDTDNWLPSTSSSTGTSNTAGGTTVTQSGSADGYSNLPTAATIAAAGSIATLVAAIGGGDVLAVCNTDWYDDLPSSAFSDKSELSDVTCIDDWGDGSSMADCYKQIAAALPQDWTAAVVVDENTYESAYDDYFNERCIYVVVLEAYGTADVNDDWIADDVEIVAELIGTDYAKSQYQAWNALYTEALENTLSANGGYSVWYSHFVTTAANFLYKGTNSYVSNTPITYISKNLYWTTYVYSMPDTTVDTITSSAGSLVSLEFISMRDWKENYVWPVGTWGGTADVTMDISDGIPLQIAGSDQSGWNSKSEWATIDYYLQIAGAVQAAGYENFYLTDDTDEYVLTNGTVPHTNTSVYANKGTRLSGLFAHRLSTSAGWSVAGDDDYPIVIAHSASIANKIVSSAGTADEESLTFGLANIGQDYTVVVMPRGISGSWVYGTFESFLTAPYFYCLYQQDGDLSACDSYVSDFYSQFYRCGASVLENTSSSKSYGWYGYWVTAEANLG